MVNMFSLVVLVCSLGALVSSTLEKEFYDIEKARDYFEDFIIEHNKEYETEDEKEARFVIFKDNLENLNRLNKRDELTIHGINMFTDLTQEEFIAKYNTYAPTGSEARCMTFGLQLNSSMGDPPQSFDWRNANAVTHVKNQGDCSSCWTFASTGTIEGQYAIKHKQLLEFSEQQLFDCGSQRQHTCHDKGYFITNAILETAQYGGIMLEQDYPYKTKPGLCQADPSKIKAKVIGCRQFMIEKNEQVLKQYLYNHGPLAISVDASTWHTYFGGIFYGCSNRNITHAVLLVGYGVENNVHYWTIKNSYGTAFGEQGYIRIPMFFNACKIQDGLVVTAIVE